MNIIAYGIHAVIGKIEATNDASLQLLIDRKRKDKRILNCIEKAKTYNIPIKFTDIRTLDKLAKAKHQGIILSKNTITKINDIDDLYYFLDNLNHPPLLLILDEIADPHNLGACWRTADGAGVDALIITKNNSSSVTAVVNKVASGANTPIFQVNNLARLLNKLSDNGIWIIGADDQAKDTFFDIDYKNAIAIILGNEGNGMRDLTKKKCQQLISIPMLGKVSSLNISVATGIILYTAVQQRIGMK